LSLLPTICFVSLFFYPPTKRERERERRQEEKEEEKERREEKKEEPFLG